ncbi:hypothetical protein [Neorhizobium sp. IRS_2294]|uniref:hypothetical protein n=1 Tax=unclassified Neorhizobium TaxID=2629175 RepID=UPI003D283B9F
MIDGLRTGTAHTPAYQTLCGFCPGVLDEYVAMPDSTEDAKAQQGPRMYPTNLGRVHRFSGFLDLPQAAVDA